MTTILRKSVLIAPRRLLPTLALLYAATLAGVAWSAPVVVCTPSATAKPAAAQSPERWTSDSLGAMVQKLIDERQLAGVAVGIITPTQRCVATAGASGRAARPLIEPDTLFEIASISKGFTGAVLADMVAKGELQLDAPIGPQLPAALKANASLAAVTYRQLTTHTSGMPRIPTSQWAFMKAMALNPEDPYANYSLKDFMTYLGGLKLGGEKPAYEYSNSGVALLGLLLTRRAAALAPPGTAATEADADSHASPAAFEQLLRTRLLTPLGMSDTHVNLPSAATARFAQGHSAVGKPTAAWTMNFWAPTGGVKSSLRDMLKLVEASLAAQQPWAVAQTQLEPLGKVGGIGYNWHMMRLLREGGGRDTLAWHNGATYGSSSFVGVDVVRGIGVVVLSNTGASGSGQAVDTLAKHLWDARLPAPAPTRVGAWSSFEMLLGGVASLNAVALGARARATLLETARLRAGAVATKRPWLGMLQPFASRAEVVLGVATAAAVAGVVLPHVPALPLIGTVTLAHLCNGLLLATAAAALLSAPALAGNHWRGPRGWLKLGGNAAVLAFLAWMAWG